jgi:hypothetical protein
MKHIDWSNAYGVCQNVDKTFTDLTPIGEGTYGVVCTFSLFLSLSRIRSLLFSFFVYIVLFDSVFLSVR